MQPASTCSRRAAASHLDIAVKHTTCIGGTGNALVQLVCLTPGVVQHQLAVQILQLTST